MLGPFPPSRSWKFPISQLPPGATSTFHDFSQLFPTWNHHFSVPPEVCQYLLHHSMARRQLTPSVVTLAQLVEAYGYGTRWAEALQSLQVGMGGLGISMDFPTKLIKVETLKQHWNNMKQRHGYTEVFFDWKLLKKREQLHEQIIYFIIRKYLGDLLNQYYEPSDIFWTNLAESGSIMIRSQGAHRFSLQPDVVLVNATATAAVRGHGQNLANFMEITVNKHKYAISCGMNGGWPSRSIYHQYPSITIILSYTHAAFGLA